MSRASLYAHPEAKVLDRLRLAFFEELAVPVEEEPEQTEQLKLEMETYPT